MWRNKKHQVSKELSAKKIATLVQSAQLSEQKIRRWHVDFLNHHPSSHLDKKTFIEYYQKLHDNIGSQSSFEKIFEMMDINDDKTVDFNESLVVIVLMSRLNNLGSP